MKFELKKTCSACPEQYDVYLDGKQVGYLRLRHGYFRCDYPDCGGETIYSAYPKGNGSFFDDERDYYIKQALEELRKKLNETTYEIKEKYENNRI